MDKDIFVSMYPEEVAVLRDRGRLIDDWANVFEHCVTEARAASLLAVALKLSPQDRDNLVKAAFLHDWNKRNEREAANKEGFKAYNEHASLSAKGLSEMGYSKRVVGLTESVGHTSLKSIEASADFLARVMHYLDDITHGDKVVGLDERIDQLEAAPRYKDLNESGRAIHGGRTYFQVQREVGKAIEAEIEARLGRPVVQMLQEAMK